MNVTPRQRRVLVLLAEEDKPMHVTAEQCTVASMHTLERRRLVRGTRAGYRITKQGRELLSNGG